MVVSSSLYPDEYLSSVSRGTVAKELEKQASLLRKIINQIKDDDDLDENVKNNQIVEYRRKIGRLQAKILSCQLV